MRLKRILAIQACALSVWLGTPAQPGPGQVMVVPGSTKRVSQLTGDFDRASQQPTLSQTTKRFGIVGTDLGSSFEHKGNLYVVFTTDHSQTKAMGRSVLATSTDDGRTFKVLYELSRDKFINVSFVSRDGWLYLYGSGDYRKSSVCLARVKPREIGVRASLEYFSGSTPDGQPRWSSSETDAVTLFQHNVVGELSVSYLAPLARYVMLYNSSAPRGIVLRSSPTPTGPWMPGGVLFDPRREASECSCTSPRRPDEVTRSAIPIVAPNRVASTVRSSWSGTGSVRRIAAGCTTPCPPGIPIRSW